MLHKQISDNLEAQRNSIFNFLSNTSINQLYRHEYEQIRSGKTFLLNEDIEEALEELRVLSEDTSQNWRLDKKLNDFISLDNDSLLSDFTEQFVTLLEKIAESGKHDSIQAIRLEYDDYYQYDSFAACYGPQDYPVLLQPRYLNDELGYKNQVIKIDNAINFESAWIDCSEFEDLPYLNVELSLEDLYSLHSRTLLNKALETLDSVDQLSLLKLRPFTFYINAHDGEIITLYRLE